jgi:hypothetical protein
MKWFYKGKDGGYESTVTGYWLCEIKSLFSIVLLKFENGSRDAYHEHAFNSVSWVLSGELIEYGLGKKLLGWYMPSLEPVITKRETYHQVVSIGTTWVLSFRGPWTKTWREYRPEGEVILTNGRKEVNG